MREPTSNSEKGQTAIEYALMLVAIAMFLLGVFTNFATAIDLPILKTAASML